MTVHSRPTLPTLRRPIRWRRRVRFFRNTFSQFRVAAIALFSTWALGAELPVPTPKLASVEIADSWPMFHGDAFHTGVSSETTIGASSASVLGIAFQANTGYPSYTSPAAVYNPTLGTTLVYVGNQSGTVAAYDASTGNRIWNYKVASQVQSSPAIYKGVVYIGASDHYLYALDATTGALDCRFLSLGVISASPVVGNPDGSGPVVYFGDNGLSGQADGGNEWAVNGVGNSAGACSVRWLFNAWGDPPGSLPLTGSWSPPAYTTDATGRPLVIMGSGDPDDAVYALDARTGAKVWRFQTQPVGSDTDVGAGPTISPPGANGFVDGVAYISGKNSIVYALDLVTGVAFWRFSIAADAGSSAGAVRSTAALDGDRLYVGYGAGVYAINAITGAKIYRTADVGPTTPLVLSSPAIVGGSGDKAMFVGDLGGAVRAFNAATGAPLWKYQTGGFIFSSPAVADNRIFIDSSDGFLYAFRVGGSALPPPDTAILQPPDGSTPANPNGSLSISGTATGSVGVAAVEVAVKNGDTGKWWNGLTSAWTNVFTENQAVLGSGGATSTTWTYTFPVLSAGGVFVAQADAVDANGERDPTVALSHFTIPSLGTPPDTSITDPKNHQIFFFPTSGDVSFNITVTGTTTDPTSAPTPGIKEVRVVVKNIQHNEYFCGFAGCNGSGGESTAWTPVYTVVKATLQSPGAVSTAWSLTWPTYNHPHTYAITAWAVANDGEMDLTRPHVRPVCVNNPGDNSCF